MFGLFGSKKKENVADLLKEFIIYQEVIGNIGKMQSLQKLNRLEEAREVFAAAERRATTYLNQNPGEKNAHLMLVLLFTEAGVPDQAEPIIERLLKSGEFLLSDEERLILSGELQSIRRQRPSDRRAADSPSGFTQVYCCARCGRLHNFVSMPCPHCDWNPQTVEETARSIVLSNSHFKIPALLTLSREMANGRAAEDVIPNLFGDAKTFLSVPKQRQVVEQVLSLLKKNEHKNHRSIAQIRACPNCGERILFSGAEECEQCGSAVNWSDAIRALACMDNLLWLLENRIETSSTEAFSDFVCVLVAMTNNMLRKQESPSIRDRRYCLELLANMGSLWDLNKGAAIELKDPRALKFYLIKDSMREDSKSFGLFLYRELELFITKMAHGVAH